MIAYPDLEIGLHRREAGSYSVELRFSHPGSEAETRVVAGALPDRQANLAQFQQLILDPVEYGNTLWTTFFGEAQVQAGIAQALASAQSRNLPLRVRLFIGPSAPELQSLHWETLRNPAANRSLLTDENLLFSRYLSSLDWREIDLRPQSDLRALVVVANPAGLEKYGLAPIDAAGESQRARLALGAIAVTELATAGAATLNKIADCLRDDYDILYIVCHGTFVDGKPWLWLEDDAGQAARVVGTDLAERIGGLAKRPRLVVLASCQSAGGRGALSTLGPRLAEVGIPAVLAMQDDISQKTVADFIPVFFKELQRDGLIDRAMAAARGVVAGGPSDWWVPVLFMRLKSGRIWYVPGFQEDPKFQKWPMLLSHISEHLCVPIIGPAVMEPLTGSRRDIARRWAEVYHYPLAPHEREDLPQVAQYLKVDQDRPLLRAELARSLRREIVQRHGSNLTGPLPDDVNELIGKVWEQRWAKNDTEMHNVLAGLPFEIYITTNQDDLLARALKAQKKSPEVELCCWYREWDHKKSVHYRDRDYAPSVGRPLVYHLFGNFADANSLVLTEDDYFDYLIGMTNNRHLMPRSVYNALTQKSRLFIGFQTHDWPFRVLFRTIMAFEGSEISKEFGHVAVQIDPEEGRVVEPEAARRYLQSYVWDTDRIAIYWDSVEGFARELRRRTRAPLQ